MTVNATKKSDIRISTDSNKTYQVYNGDRVTGLSADDDDHLLFIADSDRKMIVKVDFKNKTNPLGVSTVLYSNLPSLTNL